ncbi:MAG: inorganic phosphate transporter [Polyangiales bacterium]
MTQPATTAPFESISAPEHPAPSALANKLNKPPSRFASLGFVGLLVVGLTYAGNQLFSDLGATESPSSVAYVLLGIALTIALGFEFVNGFHDTANAVATVIYTHSLNPHVAVAWSGAWNFIGVLVSSGAVAFGIISLLPVELILQVGSGAGFAMVFALLMAAIVWNLGTWYFGLPASSSHTLIGSIIGVGIANRMLSNEAATSGVDWGQAGSVGKSLLISPLVGFFFAAGLLLVSKKVIPDKRLYQAPESDKPPPFWIRALLILTCTGVSFAHGSNDGQKGMGLIMLILIGTVPTAYALNHAVSHKESQDFIAASAETATVLSKLGKGTPSAEDDPRIELRSYLRSRVWQNATALALVHTVQDIRTDMIRFKDLKSVPAAETRNFRNDMYMVSETLRQAEKHDQIKLDGQDALVLKNYLKHLDKSTRFIPNWVKVSVALALGLGTMIGWKRIVVTVGEKIGKEHLTYGQGGAAEITAMLTIGAADILGLPVSTTHVLSSGVAGTMAANGSGLQWGTVRNLLMAWVLTLPASIALSAGLFWVFKHIF